MNESGESETVASELVINVKTINNETYSITLLPHETVNFLKEKVSEVTGIEVDRQRLIYRGRVLVDEETVGSYSIESGHIVHMVAKPANYRELQRQASSSSSSPAVPSSSSNVPTAMAASPLPLPININNLQNATLLGGIQSPAIFQLPARTMVGQPPASVRQAMLESMARLQGGAATMNQPSAPTESRQENSRTNQDTQLENIRQGILTVNTLLSLNNEYSSEHPIENVTSSEPDAATSDLPPWRRFYVGQWIDVKDTVQQWLEATIMTVDERRRSIFVHYNGWPQRWDEWIRWDSPRIAPFRSRTTHSVLTGAACPTPNVIPPHAQRTGVSDVRTVIPELVRLYQSLQPMMTALAESVNDDLQHRPLTAPAINVAEGMPWQQFHSVPSAASPDDTSAQVPSGNDEQTETALPTDEATARNDDNTTIAEDSQDHLRQKYRDIIPLIDRFGRVLTDFSSLLWSEVDTYRPPAPANTLFGNAASQFSANSFEARLLNLLRERPPSPPPERAYQAPIHGIFRPTGSAGQPGLDHHLDIHIAFLSPTNATPASSSATVPLSTVNGTATNAATNPATTTATVPIAASLLTPTMGNNAAAGELGSTSLSRSVADLTSSLQQQAQQLARRTQELTERTSAVTEITHTLGEMLRSRREHLESLQQEQRQSQQASSAVDASSLPSPARSQSPVGSDPVYDEDQLSFDSSSDHSHGSGNDDAEDINDDLNNDDDDDDSEDSRNERQFLEDLLLREYVQGGDAEDVENERLLDIEIDLLQHALYHHQQQQQQQHTPLLHQHQHHHHHLHSHRDAQHPLLEPQEVSGLLAHEEQRELSDDTEDILDAQEEKPDDDGGVGDVIRDIMIQTEREMALNTDKAVGENDGVEEKESPVVLEDLDAGLSRAMAAVSSTGASLMPPSEDEINSEDEDNKLLAHSHQHQHHHRHHSKEQEPFYNLPNSRLVEDTNIYPMAAESIPPPHADNSTLVGLAEDIQHEENVVASSPSSPETASPTVDNKATLEMLAYGEDDKVLEGTRQTDMPFVPHDTLVETDDFVEEHGASGSTHDICQTSEDVLTVNSHVDGENATAAAVDDEDVVGGSAQRRGSGLMMFQRLFSFRR